MASEAQPKLADIHTAEHWRARLAEAEAAEGAASEAQDAAYFAYCALCDTEGRMIALARVIRDALAAVELAESTPGGRYTHRAHAAIDRVLAMEKGMANGE